MIELHSLIEQRAPTRLTQIAIHRTNGPEFCGPCPWCQGTDRFHVWPYSERAHYWCRVCERSGDAIQFLKDYCNLSFVEACQELNIEPGNTVSHAAPMFFDDNPPCAKWQDFARSLIDKADHYLWSDQGQSALSYLKQRGFTGETIKNAHLGYIPLARDGKWFTRSFADWGLTDEMLSEKQKAKGNVKVPPGILIPWFGDGQIWKLAIKRFEATDSDMKYGQVVGSKDALYGSDNLQRNKPILLCEGEFDALSALQEAGDSITAIGTGSAAKGRLPLWIARIATYASQVLLSFDGDEAGSDAATYWKDIFGEKAIPWPPYSHDINDMLRDGKDIRQWVQTGLSIAASPVPPPAREEVKPPFPCAACKVDLNNPDINAFVDEQEHFYCEACWQSRNPMLICSECGGQNTTLYTGTTICYRCQFHRMKPAILTKPQPAISTWEQARSTMKHTQAAL